MEEKVNLSIVLATHNEEKNIGECLRLVKNWCKEIIVVDGGSGDKTVTIAKNLGAKVLIVPNLANFHINKQKAIDLATSDWILQLDADERVEEKLKLKIIQVIKNGTFDGYWIPRKNHFLGRFLMKGGVYPDYTMRLYRRGKGKLPQKDVHEQAYVEGEVGYLKTPLIHMSDVNFQRYLLRWNRYTDLIAGDLLTRQFNLVITGINYLIIKPIFWFLNIYVRHKGFMDSWQGFVFAFFSGLRFPMAFIKYLNKKICA